MEIIAPNGVFGIKPPEPPKKGRPRLHTVGMHKVSQAHITKVEGLKEVIDAAGGDPEKLQAVIDSIHTEPRIYWIAGVSDGEIWDFRIGPTILPFVTHTLTFSIDIERRDRDDMSLQKQTDPSNSDKPTDPPRKVFDGSFVVTTAYKPEEPETKAAMMWPPNLHSCVEAVSMSGFNAYGLRKIFWRNSDHSRLRNTAALCSSISDMEHDAYKLTNEIRSSIFLGSREFFLGPDFFNMCRYFAAKDLVNMTPFFFKVFCTELPVRSEAILLSFFRSEKSGRRFVNGSSLVRFIDEKVTKEEIIEYLKPYFADMNCWTALNEERNKIDEKPLAVEMSKSGTIPVVSVPAAALSKGKKRCMSMSTDSSVSMSSPPKPSGPAAKSSSKKTSTLPASATQKSTKKKAVAVEYSTPSKNNFVVDSSSKSFMASWFDTLRGVYYATLSDVLETGGFYVSRIFSKEELQYIQYLSDKAIIKIYSGFNPRGASMIERFWTQQDCGRLQHKIHEGQQYYIHPFLEIASTIGSIRATINGLFASYDSGLQSYTRMKVKNALFEAEVPTYTYAEEYDRLKNSYSSILKNKIEAPPEKVLEIYNRLAHVAVRQRQHLELHEQLFLDSRAWPPGQKTVLTEELLVRDPVPATTSRFWNDLELLTKGRSREYPYARYAFANRVDKWANAQRPTLEVGLRKSVKDLVETHCKLSVTIFDMPESNVGERRLMGNVPDAFREAARAISDLSFGPSDVPSASITTRESLLFNRRSVFTDSHKKLISLHEVEKWTIQDLQEVLSACFFDWGGTDNMAPPSQTHVLWIFADRNAIDLGAISALIQMSKIKESDMDSIPEECFVDLRSACVQESETAGLAAKIYTGALNLNQSDEDDIFCVTEALYVTEYDEDCPVEASLGVGISLGKVDLVKISMRDLPTLRTGTSKPSYAKVNCLELDNWRQIYTLLCYVKCALVLVGPKQTLDLLLKASQDEFYVDDNPIIPHHPKASDLVQDPESYTTKRILYKPAKPLDLFTSFGNYVVPDPPHVMMCSMSSDQVSI